MQELASSLQQKEAAGIRCMACTRRCLLHEASIGFCTAIMNKGGTLYSTAYGVVGEVSVTPIENRPVYHYRPGTQTFCLGGLGCNLRCAFCQNWELAFRDARHGGNLASPNLTPEQVVAHAQEKQCEGIAWTFNEPSISPMYTLDCARLARRAGLYTVMVTNGMMTHEALDLLGPYIDVYRVDVKSVEQAFYQHVAGTARIEEIFPVAHRAQQEFGIHVETVTNLMPSLNDSDEHLKRLVEQIITHLGENTPWHLTTYVPYAHMTHIPPTPPETLARAYTLGRCSGLRFVYTDSIVDPKTVSTYCPTCNICIVERFARHIKVYSLKNDGTCAACGTDLAIIVHNSETAP
jgi:pyruvate formate lyase activating enzyme